MFHLEAERLRGITTGVARVIRGLFRTEEVREETACEVVELPQSKKVKLAATVRVQKNRMSRPMIDLYQNPEGPQSLGPVDAEALLKDVQQLQKYGRPGKRISRYHP